MRVNPCPCRECDERYVGCHSRCPKYLEFRKTREKLYELRVREQYTSPYNKRKKYKGGIDTIDPIR